MILVAEGGGLTGGVIIPDGEDPAVRIHGALEAGILIVLVDGRLAL